MSGSFDKHAEKLHKQFGHPSANKLISVIRTAGVSNKNLEDSIEAFTSSCATCVKFKRPNPRPVVSVPMASRFNELLAMDLKIWGK